MLFFLALFSGGGLALMLPDALWRRLFGEAIQASWSMLALASGLAGLGACLAAMNADEAWCGLESRSWEPVSAVVVESSLVQTIQPRSTNPGWKPRVAYTYRIGNQVLRSERVGFGLAATSDRGWVEQRLREEFVVGRTVTAYFDPRRPSEAVLERGGSGLASVMAVVGLVLACVGGLFLLMLRRNWSGD